MTIDELVLKARRLDEKQELCGMHEWDFENVYVSKILPENPSASSVVCKKCGLRVTILTAIYNPDPDRFLKD